MTEDEERRAEWRDLGTRAVVGLLAGVLVGALVGFGSALPILLR